MMEGSVRGEGGRVKGDVLGASGGPRLGAHPCARSERVPVRREVDRAERLLRRGRVAEVIRVAEVAVVRELREDVVEGDGGGVEGGGWREIRGDAAMMLVHDARSHDAGSAQKSAGRE